MNPPLRFRSSLGPLFTLNRAWRGEGRLSASSALGLLTLTLSLAGASLAAAVPSLPPPPPLPSLQSSAASSGPLLIFRKLFRSSSPEWVEIKVKPSGAATIDIRQLDEDADPQAFEVSPALAARLFQIAAELQHFSGIELNVKRRLANLGEKTFRYENGAQAGEVSFNYTTDPTAQELLTIFEGLSRQQEHLQTLQHRMRFDRLGVNDALLRLEVDLNRKLIPEPLRLVPMLDQIAAETRVVEIARQRARSLSDRIRHAAKPAASPAANSLLRLDPAFAGAD